ncbi:MULTISPECIES: nuclease-related domain-containing protein [Bacillaceae]|uniref:NERD domain-containing protein n=1 Tax=Evansella alkalicola TaxID=745819 RepID=A0ABS6JWJ1_9BACI|nr:MULTISPECIES: nuclease-related domain-containing protein [Bacillaceae]MBU9722957.1 NERD domain-containing protein [Bacillus alkalicola]
MELSNNDKYIFNSLKKGYEGEVVVDKLFEKLECPSLHINGILFDWNNNTFQIDKLSFLHGQLFLMEVKSQEGDYYIDNGEWFSPNGNITANPLKQLDRTKTLLQKLLQYYRISIPIRANVIFPNPQFTLYNAPKDQPIIFPTQLDQFIKQLNKGNSEISKQHIQAAERLVSLSVEKSSRSRIPGYSLEMLAKGVRCSKCEDVFMKSINRHLKCPQCHGVELFDDAILRNVKEFVLLFPEEPITTIEIFKWCGKEIPIKAIRRVLNRNLIAHLSYKNRYYTLK